MRIIIPVVENKGEKSRISSHFGRALYFALYNSENNRLKIIKIKKEGFGGRSRLADDILKYKPNVIFALGMGPRAVNLLKSKGVRIETGDYETVDDIIKNKDKLKEMEEACKESRWK